MQLPYDAVGIPKHLFWVAHAFSHGPVPQASEVDAGETRAGRMIARSPRNTVVRCITECQSRGKP
jgi:hypothetical protein